MPIELKMPALSPTMEEGTLAKWLVKAGDVVKSGDLLAEIETDKATMEFEAVDEGVIAELLVPEGSDGVKVGTVIAVISAEGEDASAAAPATAQAPKTDGGETGAGQPAREEENQPSTPPASVGEEQKGSSPAQTVSPPALAGRTGGAGTPAASQGDRVKASPLARRLAEQKGIDLAGISGSGPGGRIVKADLDAAGGKPTSAAAPAAAAPTQSAPAPAPALAQATAFTSETPHEAIKLSNMRKTIARRLTEAKQTIPHIYLTVDIRLDALLKLRGELNAGLSARGVKLSVNDMLIKALGVALTEVSECNVSFTPDNLIQYSRADISVAVSIPGGLITPIIVDAGNKALSAISKEIGELAGRAKEGKLQPHEYQGGTASLSNMGMFAIKQFEAVINPPQGMIMAIGAGEKRPYVIDDALQIASVMSATGSFDHRAIDGADGALLMKTFKELVESPLGMIA